MKLDFTLLVIDDAPDSVEQAISILRDYLKEKGFTLTEKLVRECSEKTLRELARSEGRNFDLVAIDYLLGRKDLNGALVAEQLRHELPYTDMVFYSSSPVADLFGKLVERNVAGVFPATRDQLGDALKGLADTVIGKAVDLNHMRGIGMAEVAEMDVLMEETLIRVFETENACIADAAERTVRRLCAQSASHKRKLKEAYEKEGVAGIVRNGRLFSFAHKYHAIRRVAKSFGLKATGDLDGLSDFDADVIDNRNLLAHAKEHVDANGKVVLRSIKPDQEKIVIDDAWMVDFRVKLQKQGAALGNVCNRMDELVAQLVKDSK